MYALYSNYVFFPYENEWTCISCGHNAFKQKNELIEIQRKKNTKKLKYAEHKSFKLFTICSYV